MATQLLSASNRTAEDRLEGVIGRQLLQQFAQQSSIRYSTFAVLQLVWHAADDGGAAADDRRPARRRRRGLHLRSRRSAISWGRLLYICLQAVG